MKSIVSEPELSEFLLCPLRVADGLSYPKHEFGARMTSVLTELMMRAFNSTRPCKHEIHKALDTVREINRLSPGKASSAIHGAAYEAKVRLATSLENLFQHHRVLQPVMKYRVKVGKIQLDGEYALLSTNRRDCPAIFRLRHRNLPQAPFPGGSWPTDIVSSMRYVHLLTEGEYNRACVINLAVPSGTMWLETVNAETSTAFVNAAVRSYTERICFPVPGPHCSGCLSQACTKT